MAIRRLYSVELADVLIERITAGESLRSICEAPDMPSEGAVRHWAVTNHEGFGERYTQARQLAAQAWDEKAEAVILAARDKDDIARARELAIHYRWRASKTAPREYGDKLEVQHSGTVNVAVELAELRRRRSLLDAPAQPVTLDAVPEAQLVGE